MSAEQPIPFPHKTHIEKAMLKCTEYCHEAVTKGPRAGLPSVKTCMICHDSIATDRPLIQKVTDYSKRGVDLPWQRVYGFAQEAHVRFDHSPHIRAKVDCANCPATSRPTVAQRASIIRWDSAWTVCAGGRRQRLLPLTMDRRNFIKLTAITGSAALASCSNPAQLIRFVPDGSDSRYRRN